MSLRFRRILYISFFLAFAIITPLVIIYASGSRIAFGDWLRGRFRLEKTGAFIIDTEPEGAKIFINNRLQINAWKKLLSEESGEITTPEKIKGLAPGEYELRVEKDGYWPWQKKLAILPGLATFAEHITLFKNALPVLIEPTGANTAVISPRAGYIFLASASSTLYDLTAEKNIPLDINESTSTAELPATQIASSLDEKQVLVDKNLITLSEPLRQKNLNPIIGTGSAMVRWSASDSRHIYYIASSTLNELNLENLSTTTVMTADQAVDYLVKNDRIFLITARGQASVLSIIAKNSRDTLASLRFPNHEFAFINSDHSLINAYDKKSGSLYLIDPDRSFDLLVDSFTGVTVVKWINTNILLYAKSYEIWLYELKNRKNTLLTRLSQPISEIFWHPTNNYVIFTTQDTISVIELDDREKRNITELLRLPDIKWPVLASAGDAIYFISRLGSQEGLFKLELQ